MDMTLDEVFAKLDEIANAPINDVEQGYDHETVDNYLDELIELVEKSVEEIQSLQQQLAAAKAARPAPAPAPRPIAPVPAPTASSQSLEILEMAQKIKDETIAKAEAEAEQIRTSARLEAEKSLSTLTEQKAALQDEVKNLKVVAADYRRQFESLLAAQQDALDKAANLF